MKKTVLFMFCIMLVASVSFAGGGHRGGGERSHHRGGNDVAQVAHAVGEFFGAFSNASNPAPTVIYVQPQPVARGYWKLVDIYQTVWHPAEYRSVYRHGRVVGRIQVSEAYSEQVWVGTEQVWVPARQYYGRH